MLRKVILVEIRLPRLDLSVNLMKRQYVFISLALLLSATFIVCYLYLFGQIRNFSICEQRFDGILLDEFTELNKTKVAKLIVDIHGEETKFEITDPNKIETALTFMEGRHDDWQEPCGIPVAAVIDLNLIDKAGDEIGHYGFWSRFIVYYGSLKQSNLPPVVLLPIEDKDRTALFETLDIPIELVNDRLGFEN